MKRRLSHLITLALVVACGLSLVMVLLVQLGAGRGYHWWAADADDPLAPNDHLDRSTFKLPPWRDFADVNERPLFNEDRRPTPPAPELPPGDQKPVPKLNISLSGVILTPSLHIAMIVENGKTTSAAVREGHSLPGDLSAWSVTKVKPRGATFRSSAGEELELELIAKGSGLKPPPPPASPVAPQAMQPQPTDAAGAKPGEQNAELQQRIEARRKQLQEQAERNREQHGEAPPPQPPPGQNQ